MSDTSQDELSPGSVKNSSKTRGPLAVFWDAVTSTHRGVQDRRDPWQIGV